MKRKLLIFFCLAYLLTNSLMFSVSAERSGECGDNATWHLSDDGVLTISGSGEIMDYIYEGANIYPLIKAPWRSSTSRVKKIVINPGITKIGKNAFCCLPNVTSVSIPDTVTVIGQAAFSDDTNLNNVKIPNSVTTIEKSAFKECDELTSITLPANLQVMGGCVFEGCGKLKNITLPSTLTMLSDWTFAYCANLEKITLPNGITTIGSFAFAYSAVASIELPSALQEIKPHAFYNTNLTQITIPSKVTYIGLDAFASCDSLKRVYFTGDAPSFDSHVFNSITVKAYYPDDNASWTEAVRKDYGGTVTWLAYCGKEHAWGQWKTEREASCAKEGLMVRKCTQCDVTEEKSIAKTAHQYKETVTAPNCEAGGYTTHICTVCEHTFVDTHTEISDHAFGEWVVIKKSTCLEKGSKQRTCSICQLQETEEMELSGHSYRDEVTEATCTQQGFTSHICNLCEHTVTDSYTETKAHRFGEWEVIKSASLGEEGQRWRKCADCSAEQTEAIPKQQTSWALVIGIVGAVVVLSGAIVMAVTLRKKNIPQ